MRRLSKRRDRPTLAPAACAAFLLFAGCTDAPVSRVLRYHAGRGEEKGAALLLPADKKRTV
jgi:hypothetical protein